MVGNFAAPKIPRSAKMCNKAVWEEQKDRAPSASTQQLIPLVTSLPFFVLRILVVYEGQITFKFLPSNVSLTSGSG